MTRPSAREAVLIALRSAGARGCVTGELCQPHVGGERFGARIMELRRDGHAIRGERVRQGSWRYVLTAEAAVPHRLPVRDWGSHKVCGLCGHRWEAVGMARGCPACHAAMQWTEDHPSRSGADRRARQINPGQVRAELAAHRARLTGSVVVAA